MALLRAAFTVPWTLSEVDQVRRRQLDASLHPYTCNGGNPDWATHHDHEVRLIPTVGGWKCPECHRNQGWV